MGRRGRGGWSPWPVGLARIEERVSDPNRSRRIGKPASVWPGAVECGLTHPAGAETDICDSDAAQHAGGSGTVAGENQEPTKQDERDPDEAPQEGADQRADHEGKARTA